VAAWVWGARATGRDRAIAEAIKVKAGCVFIKLEKIEMIRYKNVQ
jgi:hypothetical protein